jgi:hypothetical protein
VRRLRFRIALWLLVLLVSTVSANGMPVGAWLGTPSGLILPAGGPNVRVRSEEVRFVIAGQSAVVTARYQLENQGGGAAGEVAFAVPSGATGILVTLNGQPIEVPMNLAEAGAQGLADADSLTQRPADWLNPLTGNRYAPRLWRQEPAVYWQRFQLDLQPGLQELVVSYRSAAGQDNSQLLQPIYRYDYLLLPASRWAGFGDLTIKLETTEPGSVVANLPLQQVDERHWEAQFTQLPSANLVLFLGPPGRGPLALLWWSKSGRYGLAMGLAVLLGLLGGLLWRGTTWLRLPVALLPLLLLDRGIFEPNPIGNVAHLINFGFLPLLCLICWWIGARLGQRRRIRS